MCRFISVCIRKDFGLDQQQTSRNKSFVQSISVIKDSIRFIDFMHVNADILPYWHAKQN